jgi:predicted Zn-dependent protease with MMP-like domain
MIADAINDAMDNAFDACVHELRGHGFGLSADSLERLQKRMHDGERVLFHRP